MKLENLIYEEQQKAYFILIAIFIIIALVLLIIILFPQSIFRSSLSSSTKLILLAATVIDLILFWSFSQLPIKLTNQYLQIGFGVFKKKVSLSIIERVKIEDYNKAIYKGYGIRIGKDSSLGFIARDGRGIRLEIKPRNYFFTSDHPEKIEMLLKQQISRIKH